MHVSAADSTGSGVKAKEDQPGHGKSPDSPYLKIHRRLKRLNENEDNDMWKTEEERNGKIQNALSEYFAVCERRGQEHKVVAERIETLYDKEHYIPSEVYAWTNDRLKEMKKCEESRHSGAASSEAAKQEVPITKEPLFSQENLYHALLCCKALESSDEQNVVAVLGEQGHLFERLSVTKKECQKKHGQDCSHGTYLIAQKGDTYIVAFHGLPAIEEWKKMGKFHDGKLAKELPCMLMFWHGDLREGIMQKLYIYIYCNLHCIDAQINVYHLMYYCVCSYRKTSWFCTVKLLCSIGKG